MPKKNAGSEEQTSVAPTVVRPVSNAVSILKHLGRTGNAETVTNIARTLNINTSTCFNILRTLVAEGMLVFEENAKTYSVGLGVVQLAQHALSEDGKVEVVRPLLHGVAERHGVTITMWRFADGDRNVLTSVSQSRTAFQIQMQIGQRLPPYIGAFGRVLAARHGVPKEDLRHQFDAMRWARAPGFDDYWADVQRAAKTGWAIDEGGFAIGVTSVAVAVTGPNDQVRHGLVATTFDGQLDTAQINALAQDLLQLADEMDGLG